MEDTTPLAERMRPRDLDEVVGQEHLVGKEGILRKALAGGHAAEHDPLGATGRGQDHPGPADRRAAPSGPSTP